MELSRRISPDLRGGGGSGGILAGEKGGFRASTSGVSGRLGIRKWRGDDDPEEEPPLSGSAERSDIGSIEDWCRGFGGDLGGSTVTAGGRGPAKPGPVETGRCRGLLVGEEDDVVP